MLVTIHQPEHLPYFGLLDKINKSDIYVVLDDVDYRKHNFQNRNKILTCNGSKWLTIPVLKNKEKINQKKTTQDWKTAYRNKVVACYKYHPYYAEGIKIINDMLMQSSNQLMDYNMFYILQLIKLLNLKTQVIYSSTLNINTYKSQRLYDICKKLNATHYIIGTGSLDYIDLSVFKDVEVVVNKFTHPIYTQHNSANFIPCMCSLDIIMNIGIKNLTKLIQSSNSSTN